jgi:hypothetical protein
VQHHLQRPAEGAIAQAELEQRVASAGAHRSQIGEADAGAPAHLGGQRPVGETGVPGPAARVGLARAQAQISP